MHLSYSDEAWFVQFSAYPANRHCTSLEFLHLPGSRISGIGALPGLTASTGLYLGNNPVSDIGPLSGLEPLCTLDLQGTPVGQADIDKLRALPPDCRIYR